jgi:hypothetical protein
MRQQRIEQAAIEAEIAHLRSLPLTDILEQFFGAYGRAVTRRMNFVSHESFTRGPGFSQQTSGANQLALRPR